MCPDDGGLTPIEDPGTVLTRAFEALACGDNDGVLDRLDSPELSRVVSRRAELLTRYAESGRAELEAQVGVLLSGWGVRTLEELRELSPRAASQRGLEALPAVRRLVGCDVESWRRLDETTAVVTFRVTWPDAEVPGLTKTARLRLTPEGWKIHPSSLSSWLLPGFENLLLADDSS